MMITCRTSLSVMFLRFPFPLYLTNRVGWGFLGDQCATDMELSVPDLGLVVEPVRPAPARPEEVDDGLAAGREELGDQPAVAAPPHRLGAHEAGRGLREGRRECRLPRRGAHAGGVTTERGDAK